MLSDKDISRYQADGFLAIDPWDPRLLQPCSYDVTLSTHFTWPNLSHVECIDPTQDYSVWEKRVVMTEIVLPPGELLLASTQESVKLPNHVAARIEGKSSLGRLGLMVHTTAGFIDAGFQGRITLELLNVAGAPIKLRAGMSIAQLSFFELTTHVGRPYNGKYQYQLLAEGSRYHLNYQGQQ